MKRGQRGTPDSPTRCSRCVVIEASEGKYFAGIDEENQSEDSLLLSKVYLVKAGSKK